MNQRSYGQYCPIAHALDLIGDRWSLLIVRDLLLGPKRFSDLREGLPGIGTNILTDRLKHLEHAGVLARRTLPPPAASAVYTLTPYGQSLDGPIQALAAWGGQTLGAPRPEQALSRDTVLLTARALLRRLPAPVRPLAVALHLGLPQLPDPIIALVEPGAISFPADPPAAAVAWRCDLGTLFALAGGALTLPEALAQGLLQIDGPQDLVAALVG